MLTDTDDYVLTYDEHSKMIIERTKPDELIYEDKGTIFSMLRGVIPISKIMVKSLNDEQKAKQIQRKYVIICTLP